MKPFSFLLIILGVILLIGESHFVLGSALNVVQIPLFIIGFLWCWIKRKSTSALIYKGLLLSSFLLFLHWGYQEVRSIKFDTEVRETETISLLSYNVFFRNKYPNSVLQEIKKTDASILLVQELTPKWNTWIAEAVGAQYPYQKTVVHKGTHGLGVYSKYPIKSNHFIKNSSGLAINQVCVINVKGKEIALVNAHLASPAVAVENPDRFYSFYRENYKRRIEQMKSTLDYVEKNYKELPMIIAGDMNSMPFEPFMKKMRYQWTDVYKKKGTGMGWNFPNVASIPFPFIRLDYF